MNAINDSFLSSADRGALRLITAGSVDDGKSTLIGRLLYDSRACSPTSSTPSRAPSTSAWPATASTSLLTDGLEAEREQGITIDVAYRYSRPRCASSSSPTRRGMSSTRATW